MDKLKPSIFPESGLRFLRGLKRNNNREWFQKNRSIYMESVRRPMEELVESMSLEFAKFAPEIVALPKLSLYRIHRDTRFSSIKTPYKTHVAAVFPHRGIEKHESASFYFHISPDEVLIGGGLYMPFPDDLRAVREHIVRHHKRLKTILNAVPFRRMFGELSGTQLKRMPRGFPAGHPAEHYLRHKQFLASRILAPGLVTTPQFHKALVDTFRTLHPLVHFLGEPIVANHKARQRQDAFVTNT